MFVAFLLLLGKESKYPRQYLSILAAAFFVLVCGVGVWEIIFQTEEYFFRRHVIQQKENAAYKNRFYPYESSFLYYESGVFGAND